MGCSVARPGVNAQQPAMVQLSPTPLTIPPGETPVSGVAPTLEPTRTPTPTPSAAPTTSPAPATLAVPSASPTPTATPWCSENGRIEETEIPSNNPVEPLVVRVYLPPCYSETPAEPYPVLIMIHGQTFEHDQWDRLGMDEAADRLILAQEIRPFLLFMPLERHTDREPEATQFDKVVVEKLLPWIDANYPTCVERACRGIGGLSRGATWAVHLGFQQPQLFGSIGGHSLTPFYGDVYAMPYWIVRVGLESLPRFYLDMGEDDIWIEAFTEFVNGLKEQNVVFDLFVREGFHDESYWSAHVEEYLRWYAAAWP
jgi:enterochelin esterase-like enzyme